MPGICFFFETSDVDVWSGKNLDAWNYAIKAAGDIDQMIVVNRTSQTILTPDADLDFEVVQELPDLPDAVHVCCPWDDMLNSTSLWDFTHDVQWYLFGPASGWNRQVDGALYVPQAGRAALHSVHVASAVMFHRFKVLS